MGGLGDVVFTLPAVNALKAAFPQAQSTFLIYKEFAPLLDGFPQIDSVITLDRSRYRGLNPKTLLPEALGMLWQLYRNKFDLTIDFQGFGETGLLSLWTRAPHRWGIVYRPTRGWPYTRAVRRNPELHPIEYHLDLLQRGGSISSSPCRNRFIVPEQAAAQAQQLFADWNLEPSRPTLFIQPFTKGEHKNWPLERYLAIGKYWRERRVQVLFGGGPGERPLLAPALDAGFAVAAGAPLMVSAGLVQSSTIILGGDTGLLHLAVALGKRVVMIINSTKPGNCFPFEHPEWAVVPEDGANVSAVKPEAVIEACAGALAEQRNAQFPSTPVQGQFPAKPAASNETLCLHRLCGQDLWNNID